MSNATIYINQENQETWDNIGNKSKWVNDRLAAQQDLKEELSKPTLVDFKYPLQVNPKSHNYMEAPAEPHKTFPRNKKKL